MTALSHIPGPLSTLQNTLVQGNCLNVLPQLDTGSVDFVLTDPPYGARYKARDGRSVPNDDNLEWLAPVCCELYRVLKRNRFVVSFYGWPNAHKFVSAFHAAGFRVVGHFVFPKHYTSGTGYVGYRHECAYLLAKGRPVKTRSPIADVIPWTKYTGNRFHPTQKPLAILTPLIEAFSNPGDVVLDSFMGSGSTCLAAKHAGRDYIGIELDPTFYTAAQRRLEAACKSDAASQKSSGSAVLCAPCFW